MPCAFIAIGGYRGKPLVQTRLEKSGDFLPDLCHVKSVLSLIIFAELLSLSITLASAGFTNFSWVTLGKVSILVLWIMLASAAVLCPLRPWFAQRSSWVAGSVSYTLVVSIGLLFIAIGQYLEHGQSPRVMEGMVTGGLIAAIFAGVVLRYFYLQQQLINQQQAQLMANFNALQARIRPHFLFNSMNTIASLIVVDPATAEKMIVTLSGLLRASLSEASMVSLNQEVTLCKDYVAMEQLRLGERLKVEWRLDDMPSDQMIASLMLQPLVENAIYHGVQPLPQGGTVSISVAEEGGNVVVDIANPRSEQVEKGEGNGLALNNIQHRLAALYGSEGAIEVKKTESLYSVRLSFPSEH